MAQSRNPSTAGEFVIADGEPLNLHNRRLAAFLGWLVPGAGHYYQERKFKAAIYFVSIMSCLIVGMIVSGGRCVYASWNGVERRWQYVLQAGVGLPAIPAAVQAWRKSGGNSALFEGWFFENDPNVDADDNQAIFAAPTSTKQLDLWHQKTASGFDLGTLYTMVAGLLNILAVYDAYSGPLPPPGSHKKNPPSEDK
ncbi:MAG: hypothetical protein KF752_01845 [Pirellulaceae bacterium]|nr:hypothetical protein [Pirellulaceae bacterium]